MIESGSPASSEVSGRGGRAIVIVFAAALVATIAYFALGMPGMGHRSSMSEVGAATVEQLSPAAFAARLERGSAFVVNVHTPDEGSVAGTTAWVPYDRIAGDGRVPADRNAEILLYCRTGRMSQEAGSALRAAGYTNVAELAGGMESWAAAGLPLIGSTR